MKERPIVITTNTAVTILAWLNGVLDSEAAAKLPGVRIRDLRAARVEIETALSCEEPPVNSVCS